MKQYYDTKFNQFIADRLIVGNCPKCNIVTACGWCDCGRFNEVVDLKYITSSLSGTVPILKETDEPDEPEEQMKKPEEGNGDITPLSLIANLAEAMIIDDAFSQDTDIPSTDSSSTDSFSFGGGDSGGGGSSGDW